MACHGMRIHLHMSLDLSDMSLDVPHTPHAYAYHTPLMSMPIHTHLAYLHMPTRPRTHTHITYTHRRTWPHAHTCVRLRNRRLDMGWQTRLDTQKVGYGMAATLWSARHAAQHSKTCSTPPHVLRRTARSPSVRVS